MKVWMRIAALAVNVSVAALYGAAQTTTAPPPPAAQTVPAPRTEGAAPAATGPAAAGIPPPGAVPPAETAPAVAPPVPATEAPPVKKNAAASALSGDPATATASTTYVIGALDVLSVRVWGQPNLSGMTSVRDDGMISMQLIGEVKADGLTCEQLKTVITRRLTEFLNNPEVNVEVTRNNSKKYIITGAVNHTGPFPLNGKLTIFEALAAAGGFRDFAKQTKIYLMRKGEPGKRHMFNYKDALVGKHPELNIEIQNGDIIVVPE